MVGLESYDWLVIGLYFAILFAIAIWVIRKGQKDTEDYFLAGRNVGWFIVGASIFASNIGSEHVVGLAGTGAESGMPMAHFELHAWIVLLLGWVFLPFYTRSNVFTMPEFLEKRFSPAARWYLSIISLIGYILTKVSVSVYAGGVVIESLTGWNFWIGAFLTVFITGIYTILGGLRAVVYTEALQTIVLIAGALAVTLIGLNKIGGWNELKAISGSDHFNMWRPATDPDFPWTGLVFGGTIIGIWYWCTDQYIVQRALAARNLKVGRKGTIFGAYLKLTPVFIFLLPGIIAYAMNKTGQIELTSSDQALPVMMASMLPVGVRGLVAAGLLAALMSSLASVFNSCSTLFTVDIFKKLRPDAGEKRLVLVGRIATAIVVVLGLLWIPVMANISGVLYEYLQSVQAYLAPPITAVFITGIFWKRINTQGAMSTLISGFLLGISRLAIDATNMEVGGFLQFWVELNFLHFCVLLFLICLTVCVVVSLLTQPQSDTQLKGLTFQTIDRSVLRNYSIIDVISSILLIGIIIGILSYFTG